jgi:tetratricopeptide (TPR) repeat protein
MQRERAARSDIYTCDTLAWVLYKRGDFAGAKASIDVALPLGTRDARIKYHAGMIDYALGHNRDAVKQLQLALEKKSLIRRSSGRRGKADAARGDELNEAAAPRF